MHANHRLLLRDGHRSLPKVRKANHIREIYLWVIGTIGKMMSRIAQTTHNQVSERKHATRAVLPEKFSTVYQQALQMSEKQKSELKEDLKLMDINREYDDYDDFSRSIEHMDIIRTEVLERRLRETFRENEFFDVARLASEKHNVVIQMECMLKDAHKRWGGVEIVTSAELEACRHLMGSVYAPIDMELDIAKLVQEVVFAMDDEYNKRNIPREYEGRAGPLYTVFDRLYRRASEYATFIEMVDKKLFETTDHYKRLQKKRNLEEDKRDYVALVGAVRSFLDAYKLTRYHRIKVNKKLSLENWIELVERLAAKAATPNSRSNDSNTLKRQKTYQSILVLMRCLDTFTKSNSPLNGPADDPDYDDMLTRFGSECKQKKPEDYQRYVDTKIDNINNIMDADMKMLQSGSEFKRCMASTYSSISSLFDVLKVVNQQYPRDKDIQMRIQTSFREVATVFVDTRYCLFSLLYLMCVSGSEDDATQQSACESVGKNRSALGLDDDGKDDAFEPISQGRKHYYEFRSFVDAMYQCYVAARQSIDNGPSSNTLVTKSTIEETYDDYRRIQARGRLKLIENMASAWSRRVQIITSNMSRVDYGFDAGAFQDIVELCVDIADTGDVASDD